MKKNMILIICSICILQLSVCPVLATNKIEQNKNLRGVWVASIYNLDYPRTATTDSEKLKKEADEALNKISDLGFNAIFLQVRPSADSLYNSKIFPWSKYLTGTNGLSPDNNFDPLKYFVEEAHKRGIELHAWINPYRITKKGEVELQEINATSPIKDYLKYAVKYTDGNYYFDPAYPEVRQLVINGVLEIVNNYDIDGIHLDDYFYPGVDFDDNNSFSKYKGEFVSKDDWRRNNVTLLIKGLKTEIKKADKTVEFGVSPSGIWANKQSNPLGSNTNGMESYYRHFADSRKWAAQGLVDYIAPQIYWNIGYNVADYEVLVNWWAEALKNSSTKLYIGMADYKTSDVEGWYGGEEILRQMNLNENKTEVKGEIHYRYSSIIEDSLLYNKIKNFYDKDKIKVYLNNKRLSFDVDPTIINGRTLVPLRKIFEELGAKVLWDGNTNMVTATKDNNKVSFTIGKDDFTVNGKRVILDVMPMVVNDRTLVPIRVISESFGETVKYIEENKSIIIS